MPTTLRHNLTSAYLDAARKLAPRKRRRRIVAYVESYDDVAFWRTLLSEFEDDTRYFQVMLPSSTSLAKGKKMVLMNTLNTDELGHSLIACVDSDYDFLLQGATHTSRKVNDNPYIFQTYGYAIESFQCYAESLHEVCVQATLNDRIIVDLPAFLQRYSQIAYPLFLWNIWFYRRRDTETFPMYDFNACIRLEDFSLKQPYRCLDEMLETVNAKLAELRELYPEDIPGVIDRRSNDIVFLQGDERLSPYKLSSGEKQMLVILLTVLVRDGNHCVLFMDEPEASLHVDWQQKLIGMIRELNPNLQLILTTHSPAVIMEGWLDAVTEVSEIATELTPTDTP